MLLYPLKVLKKIYNFDVCSAFKMYETCFESTSVFFHFLLTWLNRNLLMEKDLAVKTGASKSKHFLFQTDLFLN